MTAPRHDDNIPWWYRAECRDHPDLWVIPGGVLTPDNLAALRICAVACPVRDRCFADARDRPPKGMVAGGIAWNVHGKPWRRGRPPKTPRPVPVGRRGSPMRDEATRAVEVARTTLAARGALVHAAAEAGLSLSLVRRAAVLVRRAPELAERVHSGDEVLTRAYQRVMRQRVAS